MVCHMEEVYSIAHLDPRSEGVYRTCIRILRLLSCSGIPLSLFLAEMDRIHRQYFTYMFDVAELF